MTADSLATRQRLALAADLRKKGALPQAEAIYQAIVQEFPDHAPALLQLGLIKREQGALADALRVIEQAVRLNPRDLPGQGALALVSKQLGKPARAAAAFRQVMALGQRGADVHFLLGDCLMDLGDAEGAIAEFRAALQLEPAMEEAWNNLGLCLKGKGAVEESMTCWQEGLAHHPESVPLHVNHAIALLTAGRFREGWQAYRWRLQVPELARFLERVAGDLRPWQGESLDHARLLVVSEQGFGDAIQFVRYLPELKALGAAVVLHCPSALAPLLAEAPGVDQVVTGEGHADFPYDFYVPLLSLPELLGTHGRNIPGRTPYLQADDERVARWQPLFSQPGVRVGLVWVGKPLHPNDPFRRRSFPPAWLLPVTQIPGVTCYSLQPDPATAGALAGVMELGPLMSDFAESAALIAHLDLVVTIDTATAHLAGALGKPTWVMLPMAADWRWGLQAAETPWYPNMRLFRQPAPGHWQAVVASVCSALEAWVVQQKAAMP